MFKKILSVFIVLCSCLGFAVILLVFISCATGESYCRIGFGDSTIYTNHTD